MTGKAGFPMFRHFQFVSVPAIVIILVVAVLGLRFILRKFVLFEAERDAIRISRGIRDCEMQRFFELNHGMEQSLSIPQEELPELDHQMRTFLTTFDIVKIKIFNNETKIVYSTDLKIIGKLNPDNAKLEKALKGSLVSKYETKEHVWDLAAEERFDVEIVETYVPVRCSDGRIIGSFEVYKDVTKDLASADRILIRAGSVLTVTVLSVFSLLMFVIHRVQKRKVELQAELKSAEQLKSINQKLSSEITERKEAEDKQVELVEQVENVNRELKEFASIVSHDLKAPMRGIKTLANWILSDCADKLGEQANEQMNLLLERVERMHKLIEGTLQYSRAGRTEGKRVQVNLNNFIPEIINMVVPPENITVTIENELPVIECEEVHIMQVFQNLLSNAIKYMDKLQGRIKVGCVEQNGFWKFSVADNGPGIEEKHFKKIFKIFQTLPISPDFVGTGVGLTVVKKNYRVI